MFRKLQKEDLEEALLLWEEENIKAHDSINEDYWKNQMDSVREQLPQSTVYVYVNDKDQIVGFIGLIEDYIAGLFVKTTEQSKGIGKQLLDYVKNNKTKLTLEAFAKNKRAVAFYHREGFSIQDENIDEDTREKEFVMVWQRVERY
ncbi:N-acetyltransferase [Tetragenococcus osmophilus]|uniref:Acetyltransferase n=1 Tax=Tetragenococcus osmophilus TaxID=526944 RepID=A0AA37XID9_9ENTE|nr:N-acetyltransferase [Tetragenococcus osmophilus]AYW47032.1 N-acetyltransferase [Tetragenococcus osmophilus]GMA55092.1 acetyltransferase [Alicyclobacillus contaminans]GMA71133.1 acetyltransferase [Tetragenococcus osmophilus]